MAKSKKAKAKKGPKAAKKGAKKATTGRAPKKAAKTSKASKAKASKKAAKTRAASTARAAKAKAAKAKAAKAKASKAKASKAKAAKAKAAKAQPLKLSGKPQKAPMRIVAATPGTRTSRRAPALDRERRTIRDDDSMPGPPSSLNMDRTASAVRSGRHELAERLREHTSTGPAMTGGDVDADWEDAESVGDAAPGGDNPSPDQDVVDEIGQALGITYEDNEELLGGDELTERDRHRWELDPASREDDNEEE
jgi:hypothetical protein